MNNDKSHPNILFIHTEHHRGDSLGCEGHPVLLTPNMDNIAFQGVRFSRFYSACPTCIASRRSILRGQLPQTHGMVGYRDGLEWSDVPSLPQVLRDNGYQTMHAGRSMHQYPVRKCYGFEQMVVNEDYHEWLRDMHPRHGMAEWHGGGVMHNDWTVHPWHLEEDLHHTNWAVETALRMLSKRDPSRPFFMSLGFLEAHPPFQPPAFYFERYLRTGVPDPYIGNWCNPSSAQEMAGTDYVSSGHIALPDEAFLSMRAAYYGALNHIDDQLRRIINPVNGLRHGRDTIIILTSDHGEMMGDHYRFRKSLGYEGSARVPFLLSAPPQFNISRRSVVDAVATHADIMPTLLDMLNISIPESVDGRSLYPLMRGDQLSDWREALHIEHSPNHHALTDGHSKYIWWPHDGSEQFFDLDTDPHELCDITLTNPSDERISLWRQRMIERLQERPEGFVESGKLVPGKSYGSMIPQKGI